MEHPSAARSRHRRHWFARSHSEIWREPSSPCRAHAINKGSRTCQGSRGHGRKPEGCRSCWSAQNGPLSRKGCPESERTIRWITEPWLITSRRSSQRVASLLLRRTPACSAPTQGRPGACHPASIEEPDALSHHHPTAAVHGVQRFSNWVPFTHIPDGISSQNDTRNPSLSETEGDKERA